MNDLTTILELPPIILFIGERGSGKDTAVDHLSDCMGYKRKAFADAIRQVVSITYDLPFHRLLGRTPEDRAWRMQPHSNCAGLTPVQVMQRYGTEVGRQVYVDTWVAKVFRDIAKQQFPRVAISDGRYENEVLYALKHGAMIIYLERPKRYSTGLKGILQRLTDFCKRDRHSSERVKHLKRYAHAVVINDGDILDFTRKVYDSVLRWSGRASQPISNSEIERFKIPS